MLEFERRFAFLFSRKITMKRTLKKNVLSMNCLLDRSFSTDYPETPQRRFQDVNSKTLKNLLESLRDKNQDKKFPQVSSFTPKASLKHADLFFRNSKETFPFFQDCEVLDAEMAQSMREKCQKGEKLVEKRTFSGI